MAKKTPTGPANSTSNDWRSATLSRVRALIAEADPEIVEEVKWRKPTNNMAGVPTWSLGGIVCTGETYKDKIKLTFAKGATIDDPAGLFNAGLAGGTRRAIDIHEGEKINARAFKALIKAAVAENLAKATKKQPRSRATSAAQPTQVKLLSGGNPQIPKGDGDAPVQAYIAAIPGWKQDVGRRLDAIITKTAPRSLGLRKAVKWNSPFYGVGEPDNGWFLALHCFDKCVRVTFFRGISLEPLPTGKSKYPRVRYLDVYEAGDRALDETQFKAWVKQACLLPGERL